MPNLQYYDVILKPLMTERSMKLLEGVNHKGEDAKNGRAYSFYVHPKANKTQIKEAVEKLFVGTKVKSVATMISHPKRRQRRGFKAGETVIRKKAIVKLSAGEIEVFEGM